MNMFDVISPVTGLKIASYPLMESGEVDTMIIKARSRFRLWSVSPVKERMKILGRAAELLADNAAEYAERICGENGKTRFDALLAEVYSACEIMHFYAKKAEKFLKPVKVRGNPMLFGRKWYYTFEPRGVVGIITPWNYPFTLSLGPVVSAITAGNTVVLKPAPQTPDSGGLMIKELLESAGLPKGVVHIATGDGEVTGQALIDNPGIDMFFFTGSTNIGRKVNTKAAERLVPAIMELGGKDAAIVTKNANLDKAAHAITWGAFTSCGQTCMSMELCLVERSVYEPFMVKVRDILSNLKSGTGPGEVGSMTLKSQYKKVESHVADAVSKGAKLTAESRPDLDSQKMYYPPTVITDTTEDMIVTKEETFGPLLPIIPYDNIDEAIRIVNNTIYGLSGAVFSRDIEEARQIASKIVTGSVNINDVMLTYIGPDLPFGGAKNSGIGRCHSDIGIRAFTRIKSITEFKKTNMKEFYHFPAMSGAEEGLLDTLRFLYTKSFFQKTKLAFKTTPFLLKMWIDGKK